MAPTSYDLLAEPRRYCRDVTHRNPHHPLIRLKPGLERLAKERDRADDRSSNELNRPIGPLAAVIVRFLGVSTHKIA